MKQQITEAIVSKRRWGPDDEYLTVEVQVDSSKFKSMERVKVTIDEL